MYKYDVSIIVSVYNNEKYIKECINSVIHQKYNQDKIQIILINDGSTDNSEQICKEYAEKYCNIKLINQKNQGVSAARNHGIQNAEGKYIMILDSDDFLSNNAVNDLIEFMEENPNINISSYTMKLYTGKVESEHYRNKLYDKGTNIYDINEYPYISQATVNIIFKNEFENNTLYDENMNLAEDEKFNTNQIMKTGKIGFCQNAIYYYRRHGNSTTSTSQNPYYCFEQFMSYFEYLIQEYTDNEGKLAQYVQGLILQMLKWRIKGNLFLPYYLKGEEYNKAIARIRNVLEHIEISTILNKNNMNIYHKLYLLKLRGVKLELVTGYKNEFSLNYNDQIVYMNNVVDLFFNRFKIKNNKIYMLGYIKSPICEVVKPNLYIEYEKEQLKELELLDSNFDYYGTEIKTNTFYKFEYCLDINKVQSIKFYLKIGERYIPVHFIFSRWCPFCAQIGRNTIITQDKKYFITYNNLKEIIEIEETNKKEINKVQKKQRKKYESINPKINIYRYLAKTKKEIWIYCDRKGVIDNAYYQFKHDVNKNDGIKRYYIIDGKIRDYKKYFSKKEIVNNIIVKNSFKHKIMFLRSSKILVSFDTFTGYSPFKPGSVKWYGDILHYDVIYLQHGILYANLIRMYSKEFTGIDKIVISSEFERNNFINNYLYSNEDLICSKMPRFDVAPVQTKKQNKILFAPSWRKYLIGDPPIDGKRELRTEAFLNSKFYQDIMKILNNKELQETLARYNITLEFKLHPIFEPYRNLFQIDSKYVKISEENVKNEEYSLFVTDFSSFQFDFARLKTPIIYYVPDKEEFEAGLHTYRKLDLPLEEAFGDVTYTPEDLINKMEYYIKNNFDVEPKYRERMDTFFFDTNNSRDEIYNALMKG